MRHRTWLLALAASGFTLSAAATPVLPRKPRVPLPPELAEQQDDGPSWAALPLVTYSPETELGLGAFGVIAFREPASERHTRPSSISLIGLGTTREQLILELMPEFWFSNERWHSWSKFEFNVFPDTFWGIGNAAAERPGEAYDRTILRFRTRFDALIVEDVYAGLLVDVLSFDGRYAAGGYFANEQVPGENGGVSAGVGPVVAWDTRDSSVSTYVGRLVEVGLTTFRPISIEGRGFEKVVIDVRQFVTPGKKHVFGAHLYVEHALRDVPYYYTPWFGGQDLTRGYYRGRYRDRALAVLDLEYRTPFLWRFGGVAFAGAGEVQPTFRRSNLDDLRFTAGAGLRFALVPKERLNLRLDVGFGQDSYGIYVGGGEVF